MDKIINQDCIRENNENKNQIMRQNNRLNIKTGERNKR